jgi:hypothetical protein
MNDGKIIWGVIGFLALTVFAFLLVLGGLGSLVFFIIIGGLFLFEGWLVIKYGFKGIAMGVAALIIGVLLFSGGENLYRRVLKPHQMGVAAVQTTVIAEVPETQVAVATEVPAIQNADETSSDIGEAKTALVAEVISSGSCNLTLPDTILPWCNLIEKSAQDYGVDPKLIAAVMLQESGGQADVISGSGAVGLLQVMPKDGLAASFLCANGPCFANRPSTQELLDPAYNVDFGSKMLAGLITKWGNERDALKAYGPYDVGYYYADKVLAIKADL